MFFHIRQRSLMACIPLALLLLLGACAEEPYDAPNAELAAGVSGAKDTPIALLTDGSPNAVDTVSHGRLYMTFPAAGSSYTLTTSGASSDISLEVYASAGYSLIHAFCDNSFGATDESCTIAGLTAGSTHGLVLTEWDGAASYPLTIAITAVP